MAFRAALLFGLILFALFPARAEEMRALARLDPAASRVADDGAGMDGAGVALDLGISQAVPYRAFLLADPPRLVLDFSEIDFAAADPKALGRAAKVRGIVWGPIRAGWSRLVAELTGPARIVSAEESIAATGEAKISIRLAPADAAAFRASTAAGAPQAARWALPPPAVIAAPRRRQTGEAPLTVVLDPGHGGIDPGAEAGGRTEAQVMLDFARELAEVLRRGGMKVVLTRDGDVFVPLEARISIARAAGADVFLSLHADSLAEGEATGATVYLLADAASDAASARLAERHDRSDLLAGVDLGGQDDLVAEVMMQMARADTGPRAERLAAELVAAIRGTGGRMHPHPVQEAGFSVLKSPDIPSVLLEVGFLSSPEDRRRLDDPVWRAMMAQAIFAALRDWAVADAAEARLIRR